MQQICTILTNDNKNYKVSFSLLKNYSTFFNVMLEDSFPDSFELPHISSSAFDYVYEFLQLHKIHPPKDLSKPLLKNLQLTAVMDEQDAELMQRIIRLQTQLQLEIMNCAMYLQMETFKKILTYSLLQKQLEQKPYQVKTNKDLENQIRKEIESKISNLIEMQNHRKRLAEQFFEDVYPNIQ